MADEQNLFSQALIEILKSTDYMINQSIKETTKIYDGLIVSANADGTYNIRFNNETKAVKKYGGGTPQAGQMVKVYVPQGNFNLSYFALGGVNEGGDVPVVLIPIANSTVVGGVKAYPKESSDTQQVKIDGAGFLWTTPTDVNNLNDVKYVAQTLTEAQQIQARTNIGAGTSNFSGSYNDLDDKPTIPSSVIIDENLSDTSTNPVQNKVIVSALNQKYSSINPPPYPVVSVNGQTGEVTIERYTLPIATELALGGLKAEAKTDVDTVPIKIDAQGFLWGQPLRKFDAFIDGILVLTDASFVNGTVVL